LLKFNKNEDFFFDFLMDIIDETKKMDQDDIEELREIKKVVDRKLMRMWKEEVFNEIEFLVERIHCRLDTMPPQKLYDIKKGIEKCLD
jgi:hypothetical protein